MVSKNNYSRFNEKPPILYYMTSPDDDKSNANEDRRLWRHVTKDITPLKGRDDNVSPPLDDHKENPSSRNTSIKKKTKAAQKQPSNHLISPGFTPPAGLLSSTSSARTWDASSQTSGAQDIDRRSLQKLKRGQYPIEDQLDLHGMNRTQARETLHRFLLRSHRGRRRCVLVITGKGRSPNHFREDGVLKALLPQWLAEPPCRNFILHHCTAQPKHGGSGAAYILLRRQRTE